MNVLFVGDSPSVRNTYPDKAFIGAACEKRLKLWIDYLEIKDFALVNSISVADKATIAKHDGPIVALGKEAQSRCFGLKVEYIELPHPSGRNRQLNNPDFIIRQLKKARIQLDRWKNVSNFNIS